LLEWARTVSAAVRDVDPIAPLFANTSSRQELNHQDYSAFKDIKRDPHQSETSDRSRHMYITPHDEKGLTGDLD
jgi:hypothetical protein